jgi:hypothetical protein
MRLPVTADAKCNQVVQCIVAQLTSLSQNDVSVGPLTNHNFARTLLLWRG